MVRATSRQARTVGAAKFSDGNDELMEDVGAFGPVKIDPVLQEQLREESLRIPA